jgi:hypothetical protein
MSKGFFFFLLFLRKEKWRWRRGKQYESEAKVYLHWPGLPELWGHHLWTHETSGASGCPVPFPWGTKINVYLLLLFRWKEEEDLWTKMGGFLDRNQN